MQTSLDCIPCFAKQGLEAARHVTDDPIIHERIVRDALRWMADIDLSQSPPMVAQKIHRLLRQLTNNADPYQEAKDNFNRMALEMMPDLSAKVCRASDPLFMALRFAIAGNVIDLGSFGNLTEEDARKAMAGVMEEPFFGDVDEFRRVVNAADKILYLTDNTGEIVFDRLLIEQLPIARVTVAVRGEPVLNDATIADARTAGLCDLVDVIDNGSDAPGTILADCSESFRDHFATADIIIAKGQGNFETLSDNKANIYFLFKAKCPVIAEYAGFPVGTHIAMRR